MGFYLLREVFYPKSIRRRLWHHHRWENSWSWEDWRGDARVNSSSFPWSHQFAAPDAAQLLAPEAPIKIIPTGSLGDTQSCHRGVTQPEEQQCLGNQPWLHPGPAMDTVWAAGVSWGLGADGFIRSSKGLTGLGVTPLRSTEQLGPAPGWNGPAAPAGRLG